MTGRLLPSPEGRRNSARILRAVPRAIAGVPLIVVACVVFVGCSLWTVIYSFTSSRLLPRSEYVGLAQYQELWATGRWIDSVGNIAIYGGVSLILSLILGFLFAVLLDQKIRGEAVFRTILLYPFAMSFIVTGLVWQWILNPDFGMQNTLRGLGFEGLVFDPLRDPDLVLGALLAAGLWQGTGLVAVIMLAGLRGIDEDLWKASAVDGIPAWKTYLHIVIPMMKPVFVTSAVLVATGIVKLFDLVVALTQGGPGTASEMPAKFVMDAMFGRQNLGLAFAAATTMLAVVLVILVPFFLSQAKGERRV